MLIYESMIKNLQLVPNGTNAKLLLRHSIRPQANDGNADFSWGLTREGKEFAKLFGKYLGGHLDKNFKVDIQKAKTSVSPRCKETVEMILQGYRKEIPIQEEKILHTMWIENKEKWDKVFRDYDKKMKVLLQKMLDGEHFEGVYPVNLSVAKMLQVMDFYDNTANKQTDKEGFYRLDIFATHDSLIMLLLAYLLGKNIAEFDEWIYMLEGCILWLEKSKLYVVWRSDRYEIKLESSILELLKQKDI